MTADASTMSDATEVGILLYRDCQQTKSPSRPERRP